MIEERRPLSLSGCEEVEDHRLGERGEHQERGRVEGKGEEQQEEEGGGG